jgi:hypothetical protein
MEIRGHSQISITLNTCRHVISEMMGRAAQAMNASLLPA